MKLSIPAMELFRLIRYSGGMKPTDSLPRSSSDNAPATPSNSASLVRDFIEVILNGGNLSQLETFIHSNYRYHAPAEEIVGIDAFLDFVRSLRAAFPDMHVEVTEQIAEGHRVCTQVVLTGTQLGEFNGIPPTQRTIKIAGVIISHLEEGRIREEWELLDQYAMLHQLGLLARNSAA